MFDDNLNQIGKEHSLVVQMRCTGYNLFKDTREPDGLGQKVRRAPGVAHTTKLLRVLYLDKYGIELEHLKLPGIPEALEEIGRQSYEMVA